MESALASDLEIARGRSMYNIDPMQTPPPGHDPIPWRFGCALFLALMGLDYLGLFYWLGLEAEPLIRVFLFGFISAIAGVMLHAHRNGDADDP